MVVGTVAAAAEVTVVTFCASGAAATGAGLSAGIAGPIVLAGASLLYAMHEQSIANKKQEECQQSMDELESEFKNLSALAKGEKVEKASNEEQFITNAFNNCIKQNRLSHEKLDML
jgi:predicted phage tail protein